MDTRLIYSFPYQRVICLGKEVQHALCSSRYLAYDAQRSVSAARAGLARVGVGPAVRPHQLVNLIVPMIRNRDFWVGSRSFGLREDGSRPMLDRVFISTRTMYMNPLLWNINNPLTESSCFPFFGLRRKTCPSGIFTTAK